MTSQNLLFCWLTQFWESMCILMWWMLLRHTTSDMWHELSALFTLGITTNEVLAEFNRHHSLHHTPRVAKDKHTALNGSLNRGWLLGGKLITCRSCWIPFMIREVTDPKIVIITIKLNLNFLSTSGHTHSHSYPLKLDLIREFRKNDEI